MKKISFLLFLTFLISCTSNTILKEPEDLIPKDTMSLLIQEMMIATSSKYVKNKNLQKKINYMPFVFDRFRIDSTRFQVSNLYYMSKIDVYQEVFEDAKGNLEKQKEFYDREKNKLDSINRDSVKKNKLLNERLIKAKKDSLEKAKI
ncbi:DUF4296 domain-containing protein [Polaribacter ponticola]|uniref:DUF4296 domain-containing protein n=1 Tax=Polaribacter ponticola TaxID=2978475 RepID=A0ABT5SBD3_9FLAO|nr:DUF4296 domain-containing protein [Polaribacter sp. MSW5]MDD7915431.1 DUF4296 domain-containing protein [Polaribacter sp. MSW5]